MNKFAAEAITAELCRRSLAYFVRHFWSVVDYHDYINGWHIDVICDHLQHLGEMAQLLVACPPRCMKSMVADVFYPAWAWAAERPELRFIYAHYSLLLGEDAAKKFRLLVNSTEYRSLFGIHLVSESPCDLVNNFGGKRKTISVAGTVTGLGGDIQILDDPINVSAADTLERRTAIDWFNNSWINRTESRNPRRLVIGQRVHKYDVAGEILRANQDREWATLILPYDYAHEGSIPIGWPKLGHVDPRTKPGEPLWPERFSEREIKLYKRQRATWECQYNQQPTVAENAMFSPENFRYYHEKLEPDERGELTRGVYVLGERIIPKSECWRLMAADLASTVSREGDYTAVVTADVAPTGDIIVTHVHREKIPGVKVTAAVAQLQKLHNPAYVVIEYSNFDKILVDELRMSGVPVRGEKAILNKEVRAYTLAFKMSEGQFWFPRERPWLAALERELLSFPGGDHDDMCDACSTLAIEANKRTRFKPRDEEKAEVIDEDKRYAEMLLSGLD